MYYVSFLCCILFPWMHSGYSSCPMSMHACVCVSTSNLGSLAIKEHMNRTQWQESNCVQWIRHVNAIIYYVSKLCYNDQIRPFYVLTPQAAKREAATLATSGVAYEAHVALYGVKKK